MLSYSTYLGGSNTDTGFAIAADSAGSAYVTGSTSSIDFPTQDPLQPSRAGTSGSDVFVTKFTPDGLGLDFSTYIGGSSGDEGYGIAVDTSGNAYITGNTDSSNFPTTAASAAQPTIGGGGFDDAFFLKLDPTGSTLVYSTYLGGNGTDLGIGVAIDGSGAAHIRGSSKSTNAFFPTGGFDSTCGSDGFCGPFGSDDAFLAKIDPSQSGSASFPYFTFPGGSSTANIFDGGVAVDSSGIAYISGITSVTDLPTTPGAFQPALGGQLDAFIAKFDSTLSGAASLLYMTYLGGAQSEVATFIGVDSASNVLVTGGTFSGNFPTMNAYQSTHASFGTGVSVFLTKLDLNQSGSAALLYSTFLGGTTSERGTAIAVDVFGRAYVTGETSSSDFPLQNPIQATYGGGTRDAFVAQLDPSQSGSASLVFSTFLGGTGSEFARGIATGPFGEAFVTGNTLSTNFPTASFQNSNAGGSDAFVAKITPTLIGPTPYLCQSDSPFFASIAAGTTYLETFEDGLFNTPGVTASAGAPFAPMTDSVDCDDGAIDGSGTAGLSFFSGDGVTGITFTFNATDLGGFPTHAGIAWTDGGGTTTFEAFDNVGASLGVNGPVAIADGSISGTTAEDRFFGAVNANGISKIHISNSSGGIEVDHLQYGPFTGASPLSFVPARVDFGSINAGSISSSEIITVTNSTNSPINIASISVTGDFAIKTPDTNCPVAGGAFGANSSCDLFLQFAPTAVGTRTGFARIVSDASGSPHVVPLTGTGVGAAAVDPVAFIHQPLVPASVAPGSGGFTLNIRGAGFTSNSMVHWNGNPRTTTFISSNEVSALIGSEDLTTATTAEVAVDNPAPGGSGSTRSNIVFFPVATPIAAVSLSKTNYAVQTSPLTIVAADFNNDGELDLATPNNSSNTVSVLLGNGNGTFQPQMTFLPGASPRTIAGADFNNDGNQDLAVTHLGSNVVSIHLGNGDGTFQAATPFATASGPEGMAVADLNGDGSLDLAVTTGAGVVSVLLGVGDGTFQPRTDYVTVTASAAVAVGDFNADGKLDLAVINSLSTFLIFPGNGDGTFQAPTAFNTGNTPRDILAADFNHDDILDIAVSNYSAGTISIFPGNGNGTFQSALDVTTPVGSNFMTAQDFNGDGDLDLAASNVSGSVLVFLGHGDGTLQSATSFAAGSAPFGIAAGDFDNDGRLDVAVSNYSSANISVFLTAPLGPGVQLSPTSLWTRRARPCR